MCIIFCPAVAKNDTYRMLSAMPPRSKRHRACQLTDLEQACGSIRQLLGLIMHPTPLKPVLDQRTREDKREQHPGHGRGLAQLAELKRRLVDIEHHRGSGVRWPALAARHHKRLAEQLKR